MNVDIAISSTSHLCVVSKPERLTGVQGSWSWCNSKDPALFLRLHISFCHDQVFTGIIQYLFFYTLSFLRILALKNYVFYSNALFSHLVLDLTQTHLKQVKYWVDHTLGLVGWTTCLSAILEPNLDLEFLIKCCYSQFIHDTIFKHFPQWHLNINTIKKLFLTTWVMTYQPEAIRMLFLFFLQWRSHSPSWCSLVCLCICPS